MGVVAPITHPLPPQAYGPWEQVTHDLVEGLVGLGLDVTLLAPGGSRTSAKLVVTVPTSLAALREEWEAEQRGTGGTGSDPRPANPGLWTAPSVADNPGYAKTSTTAGAAVERGRWLDPGPDPRVWEELHIATAMEMAADGLFDVVHSHLHVHALVFSRLIPCPMVTTLHGSAWNRAHHPVLAAYADQPFVSISDAERAFFPGLDYVATVHNGIRTADLPLGDGAGGHLLFAGRMAPEKAPDLAVEVARRSGIPLRLAGPVEDRHRDFFEATVAPHLGGGIEYLGSLPRADLPSLYRSAAATLMPLRWDEPFGLVVAESLASGTPVIAWRRGAMPELVRDGQTGFVVDDVEGAVAAVARVRSIDRSRCREDAVRRFDLSTMARGYASVYEALAS